MAAGWTLEDVPRRLSYPALLAFIGHLPMSSAFHRVRSPEESQWTGEALVPSLLAQVGYRLDILAWQQSKDGQKGRNRPRPWATPWVKNSEARTIGRGAIPASQWEEFWGDGG